MNGRIFVDVYRPDSRTSADRPATPRSPKNLGEPSSRIPRPQRSPRPGRRTETRPSHILGLGRSKSESAGLVFTTESGTAVDPRSALRAISTAAKDLGVSGVGLHTLRHSIATQIPRDRRAAAYSLGATRALLRRGYRGRVPPRLQPGRALCRPAALSSNGQLRMCAMATPMATRQQRGRFGFCPKRPLTCCFPSG
jgi:hypothetical protein